MISIKLQTNVATFNEKGIVSKKQKENVNDIEINKWKNECNDFSKQWWLAINHTVNLKHRCSVSLIPFDDNHGNNDSTNQNNKDNKNKH